MSAFLDTNILVYGVTFEPKAHIAATLLKNGGIVSTQVMNEFVDVIRRKQRFDWRDTALAVEAVRTLAEVVPLTVQAQALGLEIASERNLRIFDACIIASASLAGCKTLYTEDMADGAVIAGVSIVNPFKGETHGVWPAIS